MNTRNNYNYNLLTQNSKINKTSKHFNAKVYNFSIPAYKTKDNKLICVMADTCIKFCYAQKGFYKLAERYAHFKYLDTLSDNFIDMMIKDIKGKKANYIRVHDGGDYYSKKYLLKWLKIAELLPNVRFYSYTNNVTMIRSLKSIPNNFDFIFSDSGKQSHMRDLKTERHTKIFDSLTALKSEGYTDTSNYDLYATKWHNKGLKVGLVIH